VPNILKSLDGALSLAGKFDQSASCSIRRMVTHAEMSATAITKTNINSNILVSLPSSGSRKEKAPQGRAFGENSASIYLNPKYDAIATIITTSPTM